MRMDTILRKENPTMKTKKAFLCASLAMLGLVAASFSFLTPNYEAVSAHEGKVSLRDYDFTGETDVASTNLAVKVTAATKTTMGESFTISFSTGGTGYQDNTRSFVVAPTDSASFTNYYDNEFKDLTLEDKEKIEEEYEAGEYQTKAFGGQIYSILAQPGLPRVYIPRTLARGIFFRFDITEIAAGAFTLAAVNDGLTTVSIPNTITTIYADSFPQGLDNAFTFNVEFEEDEVPDTWAADWAHGAKVNYGYEFPEDKEDVLISGSPAEYGDKTLNYIIGYYPSTGTQYPLVMSYKLVGETETRYYEFSKSTTSSIGSDYDGVGYVLYGYSNSLYADVALALADNQEIDFDSVKIHNIYPAKQNGSSYVPDTENKLCATPMKSFSKVLDVTNFISYRFGGISTFGGYTSVDLIVDQAGDETYKTLRSNYFNQYKADIDSGKMYIRYRFSSLTSCKFNVTYSNGADVQKSIAISTPINQHTLSGKQDNYVSFLFKNSDVGAGFNANTIRQLNFDSFYVTLDLFSRETGVVARSGYTARFGYMMVMPYSDANSVFDINALLIILSASYVAAFAVLSVVGFFYFKNKYKNDEFRRLKPKSYWFKAVLAMLGSLIVILCVAFVIIRITAFNNAIVVYNPVDAFIIVTAVASVLIIGYFIKYLVGVSKANKERRRILKLKLNEDVEDDGTK